MPLIQFYASDEDFIKFKSLSKEDQKKVKLKLRVVFKEEIK